MDKLRTCVCVSTYVQMCMYICVSVKIKKGFDIQYLLSIIGASLSSPTLTMSTAPLSVCVCAVRTYVMPYSSICSFTMGATSEPL